MCIKREQEMEASFEVIAEPDKDMIRLTMTSREGVRFFSDMQEAADWLEGA